MKAPPPSQVIVVSTYGRWLKKKALGALDRLDRAPNVARGSNVVAERAVAGGSVAPLSWSPVHSCVCDGAGDLD